MSKHSDAPNTLLEAVTYFADADVALAFVANLRWPNGPECPSCGSQKVTYLKTRRVWKCRDCAKQFSVKVGTIFEDSPIALSKWLPAMWMIVNDKNGISSYELARALGVTQKTAWFMLHRLRKAMEAPSFQQFGGHVEADETFIGGKARNMHVGKRNRVVKGRGPMGKVVIMGLLARHGLDGESHSIVQAQVVPTRRKHHLHAIVNDRVSKNSALYTDDLHSYQGLNSDYVHNVIDHAEAYVDGQIHTNGLENFWSLLKRAIKGTYVSVEPFHLFRYLDEQTFRFNNRKNTDRGRFMLAMSKILNKRLTYNVLTGNELPETC